jgi:two-component system response regulator RegA
LAFRRVRASQTVAANVEGFQTGGINVQTEISPLSPDHGGQFGKSLLIVDDDKVFCDRLSRAMASRGFAPRTALSVAEGLAAIKDEAPAFAVIDLKLGDGSGLDVIRALKEVRSEARAIVLTGYGAIATAVVAVKLGAFDFLAKPANADEIVSALTAERIDRMENAEHPMSADRVRWEHIQRVFESCDRKVSETARQLSMHRRTLQRILAKRAPR